MRLALAALAGCLLAGAARAETLRWRDPNVPPWPGPLHLEVEARPQTFEWWIPVYPGEAAAIDGIYSAPVEFPASWGCADLRGRWSYEGAAEWKVSGWSNTTTRGECLVPTPVPIPVPEPGAWLLFAAGLLWLATILAKIRRGRTDRSSAGGR